MRVREKRLSVIVMNIALILLCLVLFTAHLSSGMFARYVTTASGEDNARVAQYDVEITPIGSDTFTVTEKDKDFNHYGEAVYSFKITNNSEVPVRYQLDVALTVDDAFVNAYNFGGSSDVSDIYERMIHNVKLADITDASAEPVFVEGVRGTDKKYTFTGLTDESVVLERGESRSYTLMLDTDVVARYADDETGTGSRLWNKVSDVTGTKYHWDFERVNVKYDITAKTVQID